MGETARAAVATVAYIVAIVGSMALFLFSLARLLRPAGAEHGRAALVLSGVWLLFVIGGGYVWFRFMSVVQPV